MRTHLSLLRASLRAPQAFALAAVLGAACYVAVYTISTPKYQSTAKLELLQKESSTADPHLKHQQDAQTLDTEMLAGRLQNPNNLQRLPWLYEYRAEALQATGLAADDTVEDAVLTEALIRQFTTSANPEQRSYAIEVVTHDPTLSAALANALARSAVVDAERVVEEKRAEYIQFVQSKIDAAQRELEEKLEQVASLEQSAGAWNRKEAAEEKIEALHAALRSIVQERLALETKISSDSNTPSEFTEQEYYLQLQEKILENDVALSQASKELGPKHPRMKQLQTERAQILQLLEQQQLESKVDAAKLRSALTAQEDVLREKILTLRSEQAEYERESNAFRSAKADLSSLQDATTWWSTQLSYARTKRGSFSAPVRLSVPASAADSAISPFRAATLAWCAILSILLLWSVRMLRLLRTNNHISIRHTELYLRTDSVAVVPKIPGLFISDMRDVKSVYALETTTERQGIGAMASPIDHSASTKSVVNAAPNAPTVPCEEEGAANTPKSTGQVIHLLPQMVLSSTSTPLRVPEELQHAFRHLQNRIIFQLPKGAKAIAITSAIPFEGKSTVTSQLALSMAKAGYKTLLIDASIVSPTKRPRAAGLAEILRSEIYFKDALLQSQKSGLWSIGSGNVDSETRGLLYSKQFQHLLNNARTEFDTILIDCPAIAIAAESIFLSDCADAYLLVTDFELGDRVASRFALQQLQKTTAFNAGLVLNRYDSAHSGLPKQMSVLA